MIIQTTSADDVAIPNNHHTTFHNKTMSCLSTEEMNTTILNAPQKEGIDRNVGWNHPSEMKGTKLQNCNSNSSNNSSSTHSKRDSTTLCLRSPGGGGGTSCYNEGSRMHHYSPVVRKRQKILIFDELLWIHFQDHPQYQQQDGSTFVTKKAMYSAVVEQTQKLTYNNSSMTATKTKRDEYDSSGSHNTCESSCTNKNNVFEKTLFLQDDVDIFDLIEEDDVAVKGGCCSTTCIVEDNVQTLEQVVSSAVGCCENTISFKLPQMVVYDINEQTGEMTRLQ